MVLVGLPVLVLVGLALIYTLFTALIVYPWINEQFGTGGEPWWKRVALWPLQKLADLGKRLVHRLTAYFARVFVNNEPAIGRWLHRQALAVEQLSGVILDSVQWTYEALVELRKVTIPTLIAQATAPLKARLTKLESAVGKINTELDNVGVLVNSTLGQLPWGKGAGFVGSINALLGSYRRLWAEVFGNLAPRLNQFLKVDLPALRTQLFGIYDDLYLTGKESFNSIRLRVGKIETFLQPIITNPTTWLFGLLGAAMVPALTAGGMRTAFGNLTCRNTQTVAKTICAADEAAIAQLLAMFLGFGILMDPKLVLSVGKEVEGAIDGVYRTMAGL